MIPCVFTTIASEEEIDLREEAHSHFESVLHRNTVFSAALPTVPRVNEIVQFWNDHPTDEFPPVVKQYVVTHVTYMIMNALRPNTDVQPGTATLQAPLSELVAAIVVKEVMPK